MQYCSNFKMLLFFRFIYSFLAVLCLVSLLSQPPVLSELALAAAQCCKEQYCIGTWNVRSMNQGKLEVVKQEMARVDVNIVGISELQWTGMGELR